MPSHVLVTAVAFVSMTLWGTTAQATDTVVAGNLAWASPLKAPEVNGGWGFDLRLGQRLNGEVVAVTGELDAGYYDFGGPLAPAVYRGMAGARLGVGAILRPLVFVHAGLARATFRPPPGTDLNRTGFTYDVGGGLDFVLLPLVNLGVYAGYNFVASTTGVDSLKWASLGLNAELVF